MMMERYEFSIDGTLQATLLRCSVLGRHWIGPALPLGSVDSSRVAGLLMLELKQHDNQVTRLRIAQVATTVLRLGSMVEVSLRADAPDSLLGSMDATTASD